MKNIKSILCYGDSNTYGYRPDGKGRYSQNVRWTGILQNRMGKGYHILEEGCCGRTTVLDDPKRPYKNGQEFLLPALEIHSPVELIILMLGTNDCKWTYQQTAEQIGEGIKTLIEIIKGNPKSNGGREPKILLVSPIHLKESVWKEQLDLDFNKKSVEVSRQLEMVYGEIAKQYDCDFFPASNIAEASDIDGEHLDEIGHKKLAEALKKIVANILIDIPCYIQVG